MNVGYLYWYGRVNVLGTKGCHTTVGFYSAIISDKATDVARESMSCDIKDTSHAKSKFIKLNVNAL